MGKLKLEEQVSVETPSTNKVAIYPKPGGRVFKKDDTGKDVQLEETNYHFPDSNETDQGVNGNGFSIKDCIDSIGSKKGTIYLKHDSNAETTIYTVSTDLIIPENICFMIENGAIVSVDNGKTLIINGVFEAGLYQVFSGDESVNFGSDTVSKVYPQWWGGKPGVNNENAITKALASMLSGGILHFTVGIWDCNVVGEGYTMVDGLILEGEGSNTILDTFVTHFDNNIDLSNIIWRNFKEVNGQRHIWRNITNFLVENVEWIANSGSTNRFCEFVGANHVIIRNSKLTITKGQYPIFLRDDSSIAHNDILIEGNTINQLGTEATYPAGIDIGHGTNIRIIGNYISNIQPFEGTCGYGIYQGDNTNFSATDIIISNNIINNCDYGIKFHNASNVIISDNKVTVSGLGAIGAFDDLDPVTGEPKQNWTITGNICFGGDILFGNDIENVVIASNIIKNGHRGIAVYSSTWSAKNISIIGNVIKDSDLTGIFAQVCTDLVIASNIVNNGNTTGQTDHSGSGIDINTAKKVLVANNYIYNDIGSAINKFHYGIYIHDTVKKIICKDNYIAGMVNDDIIGYYNISPTSGTWNVGDIIWFNKPTAGNSPGVICTTAGTFSVASDNTGSTDGTTNVITGMMDTSDFNIGDYVNVSAGFPTTGPYRLLDKTETSITINVNSNTIVNNITVETPDPIFKTMANLAS